MLWLTLASAKTINVPEAVETLHQACAEAENNDTIQVNEDSLSTTYCTIQDKSLTIDGVDGTVNIDPIQVIDGAVVVRDVRIQSSVVSRNSTVELERVTLVYADANVYAIDQGLHLHDGSTLTSTEGLVISDFAGDSVGIQVIASDEPDSTTTIALENCTLENNVNHAISVTGGPELVKLALTNCALKGNGKGEVPPAGGGAVYARSDNVDVTIEGGFYEENSASSEGGALHVKGNLSINGGTFKRNSAGSGSAIWHKEGRLQVTSPLIVENTVSGDKGGALYSDSAHSFSIQDAQFAMNKTDTGSGPPALAAHNLPSGSIVQYSRFCGSEHSEQPDGSHTGAAEFTSDYGLTFIRNVVDSNPGGSHGVTIAMGGSTETWFVEQNTFAGNGDEGSTLAVAGGHLQVVNNFFDTNSAGISLFGGELSTTEHSNAFRGTEQPQDWSNSILIQDPAYVAYDVGVDNCEQFPNIQGTSDLANKGSVDTIANHVDDSGRPDIGATFVEDGSGDTGPPDTGQTVDSDTPPSGDIYNLGPASGGCSSVPAPLWLGLMALLARRSRD